MPTGTPGAAGREVAQFCQAQQNFWYAIIVLIHLITTLRVVYCITASILFIIHHVLLVYVSVEQRHALLLQVVLVAESVNTLLHSDRHQDYPVVAYG
jgi:hypothetical protein